MNYGKLTVIREYKSRYIGGRPCRRFECICECGKTTNPTKEKVLKGATRSCGCMQIEMRNSLGKTRMLAYGVSASNQVFSVYKKTAKKRGYEFSLTKEYFLDLITKPCIYCGDNSKNKLQKMDGNGFFVYTGIDRYDNKLGYTIENSVPCCRVCNRIKTDMTIDQMSNQIDKIINNSHMWRRTA